MIDTDKYEGHTPAPWKWIIDDRDTYLSCFDNDVEADENLIADAPLLLAEVKRLHDELDKQMEYIEWLEQFAPKAGQYNTSWDAYELAMGIQEDEEE